MNSKPRVFLLHALSRSAARFLLALRIVMILGMAGSVWGALASGRLIAAIGLPISILIWWGLRRLEQTSDRARVELTEDALVVRGCFYGRRIPFNEISPDERAVLDLEKERDWMPFLKLNGAALPGLYLGWFLLRNRKRALAFVTSTKETVRLMTLRGQPILLSIQHPREFLDALALSKPSH